jgi:S-disulfanyl-L-cysteine oxidoreductase SoxD
MFSCRDFLSRPQALFALFFCAVAAQAQTTFAGLGRPATAQEIAAWDIDVRPDFKGLPKGQGSVAKGQDVWEAKCASCHGVFGESNEFFSPIVGGTTKEDITTGRVARLNDNSFPGRTTLMKLATVSTLWDYIRRAMPWNAPKTLSTEEVYAVTAFVLSLGGVVADDFVLSDQNIADVQKRLPNRNGMTTDHALWPGAGWAGASPPTAKGKADVQATACMKDCWADPQASPRVTSQLPDFARNAHGNLAEQNRLVGAQRGADTRPFEAAPATAPSLAAVPVPAPAPALALLNKFSCTACHGFDTQIVGPALADIAKKHATRTDALDYLANKARAGSAGVWGAIAMPAQAITEADAKTIAAWLLNGAKK